jgi:hypothetical protein
MNGAERACDAQSEVDEELGRMVMPIRRSGPTPETRAAVT